MKVKKGTEKYNYYTKKVKSPVYKAENTTIEQNMVVRKKIGANREWFDNIYQIF